MESEIIIERSMRLPLKVLDPEKAASDDHIWEGNENSAHFKLTKEVLPVKNMPPIYALSVSGDVFGRDNLVRDFCNTFGEPLIVDTDAINGLLFCLWNAREVDAKIKQQ